MNEKLQEKMIEYLGGLEHRVGKVEDFAMEQIPDVARQWIAWETSCDIALILVFCLLILGCWWLMRVLGKYCDQKDLKQNDKETAGAAYVVVFLVALGFAAAGTYFSVMLVKVCVAPKVVLLEKIAELAKGK